MPRWILAFADRPAAAFDAAARFWTAVTDTGLSARRGADAEFATFLPASGDACLKLQGVRDGGGGVHLDLEFDDPVAASRPRRRSGAAVVRRHGDWAVMASPTGIAFCVLPWTGAATPAAGHRPRRTRRQPRGPGVSGHRTGGVPGRDRVLGRAHRREARPARFPEFAWLDVPDGLPIRLLFQRRTPAATAATAAHIDLACSDPAAVRAVHEELRRPVRRAREVLAGDARPRRRGVLPDRPRPAHRAAAGAA